MGARVGITGRDLERAEQAGADIRAASGNPDGWVLWYRILAAAQPSVSRRHAGVVGRRPCRRATGAPLAHLI